MTDTITLPRAVALEIREALLVAATPIPADQHRVNHALIDLEAALEAQEDEALLNEPVAMRYDGDGYGYLYIDSGSGSDWQRRHKDAEPLYLAPPKPDAKPEPATDEQIVKAGGECAVVDDEYLFFFETDGTKPSGSTALGRRTGNDTRGHHQDGG
jgi:hypothetical protein